MMGNTVLSHLEQNRKRLQYYFQLKEKSGTSTPSSVQKWIEIYTERTKELEAQAQNLGLKVQLGERSLAQSQGLKSL